MNTLTREEILKFNLADYYANFLASFIEEFTNCLRKRLEEPLRNKLRIKKEFENLKDNKICDCEDFDKITYRVGNMRHCLKVELYGLQTQECDIFFKMQDNDSTYIRIKLAELFEDKFIDTCVQWLSACELPKDFTKRLKKNKKFGGQYEHENILAEREI